MNELDIGLPLHFFSAGEMVAPQGWTHQHRNIETSVLILVESGCFAMVEDEEKYELHPHDAFVLRAGHHHYGVRMQTDTLSYPPRFIFGFIFLLLKMQASL